MKQGGKSIIGLWKWNDRAIFEKGDFVIKGENIYRVNSITIEGTDPDVDSGNGAYELYPGNRIDTKEEYEEIVNNSESAKDLYVSSSALNSILKDVYFGLDSNGIIDSTIDVSEENVITTSEDISTTSGKDILDELIDPDTKGYNNGTIKVSKNLPSIKNLVGHPDESELVPRNGKRWVVCDRGDEVEGGDADSPTRCRKCWECVRCCRNGRIKKTIDNKLIINNGDPENINEISEDEAKGFEDAVNICPYRALSYTSSSEAAIAESNYYLDSTNGVTDVPTKDLIVFGAKTYKKKEQGTVPGSYAWVNTGSSVMLSYHLIGIAMPGSMFETYSNVEYMNRIKTKVEEFVAQVVANTGGVEWYKQPGEDLATGNGIVSQQTTDVSDTVRTTITVTETYNQTAYQPKAICMFKVSSTTALSSMVEAMLAIKEDIDRSYNGGSYTLNWKHYINYNTPSAALPGAITIFTGSLTATSTTYTYQQQGSTTVDVYKTTSYSPYLCAFIDALDCIGEAVGGSKYDKCRITQSAASADPSLAQAWGNLRTRRFPSKWSSTLYPDSTKLHLDEYPIGTYWDYWGDPDIVDHDTQKNYYASWRLETWDGFYAASYNLTGNIFCVKIPEEAVQYLNINNSSLTNEEKQAVGYRIQAILARAGGSSGWPSPLGSAVVGFLQAGGVTNLQSLQDIISLMGYCDSVFNVTFGRYFDNTYISGSNEFVQGVENKIINHEYYYKLDQSESALGSADVFDKYTVNTTLDEWGTYSSPHPGSIINHYIHNDTSGDIATGTDGPGFALLPRILYSEWTSLVLSANLESDEADGTNNSRLLLVPRWMSESGNTPLGSGQCYTNTDDRTPFWNQLHEEEGASSPGTGIDTNIKFIDGYFNNNFFVSTADKYAILKQYSYYGSSGKLQRVQELIDPDYGEMFIRSSKNLDWKPCVVNDKNTVRKMARLFSTLDTFRQNQNTSTQITNSTYGTSAMSTWRKDAGWELSEAINDRHYFVRNNVAPAVFILLVKAGNKYYNITIYTSRNSVDATYNITQDVSISVKYSTNLNKVFIICSYGVDLEDIYYGK